MSALSTAVLAADIAFRGIWGQSLEMPDVFEPGVKYVAFVVVDPGCDAKLAPHVAELTQWEEEFRPKGLRFAALYPNADTDTFQMAMHGTELDLPFWLLKDETQGLRALLKTETAGEALLVDAELNVRYRGGIKGLEKALDEVTRGANVTRPTAAVDGCPVPKPAARAAPELTYAKDVAKITQARCEPCHRPGQPVPFVLDSYEAIKAKAPRVRDMVEHRRMPPWSGRLNEKAFGPSKDPGYLTDAERRTLLDWLDAGAPEGDRRDLPAPRTWPDADTWHIGKPDLVKQMSRPFAVPATGVFPYQYFRVKMNSPTDRWVRAVEVQPGNGNVVHHVQAHLVPAGDGDFTGTQAMLALYGLEGNAKIFAGYVPGDNFNAKTYAPNEALRIPAKTDILLEMHYMPNGKAQSDQSRLGMIFADHAPTREIHTKAFVKARGRFKIPAGDPHAEFYDEYYFPKDVKLLGIKPHMHVRGKSFRLEIEYADGRVVPVLTVPAYDFNWQRTYEFAEPLSVPSTATLRAYATFDNSFYNPYNPDPSADVYYGIQSADEMFNCRFNYYEK
jgi:mono/diheme cytochrome c family protein